MDTIRSNRRRVVASVIGTIAIIVLAAAPSLARSPVRFTTSSPDTDTLTVSPREADDQAEVDDVETDETNEVNEAPEPLGDARVHQAVEDDQGEDSADQNDQGETKSADQNDEGEQEADEADDNDDNESAEQSHEQDDESDDDGESGDD
ncbi:MAG TPA: hypothetical protein VGJ46_07305 [Candidatus Limnocylindrales bacterium]|jgi:hypothetical protein